MKKIVLLLLLINNLFCQGQSLYVRSSADYLRLRKDPDVSSQVIKVVMRGDGLGVITDTSETRKTVIWNGESVSDYWYQIKYNGHDGMDSTAWVFAQGISLSGLSYGKNLEQTVDFLPLKNRWISMQWSSREVYNRLILFPVGWQPYPFGEVDSAFVLTFKNGSRRQYNDSLEYKYNELCLGEMTKIGYYIMITGGCCTYFNLVNNADGSSINSPEFLLTKGNGLVNLNYYHDLSVQPVFAPDGKTFAFVNTCEPGGESGFGLARLEQGNFRYLFYFDCIMPFDFRFIDNQSGILKMSEGKYMKVVLE